MSKSYIVMGVSGCGKSTIGELIAESMEIPFYDGDDFHPEANVAKMASGTPLNDDDRKPWLETLASLLKEKGPCVIACSALKAKYRDILRAGSPTFVYLHGTKETLLSRLTERSANTDHFMPASLLDSQLDTLESPQLEEDCITLDITLTPTEMLTHLTSQVQQI